MDVEAIRVRGEWIRHAPHHSDLLGRSATPTEGRWQHANIGALYLADTPETAAAEWYRFLAERGLPPSQAIPHDRHHWQLDLELADLSTRERLRAVNLEAPRPLRRTWPAFQVVGETLARSSWAGLLAPSAARPDALIVCVFDDGSWPPRGYQPLHATEITDAPPPPIGMTT